jgi:hypothetical protein
MYLSCDRGNVGNLIEGITHVSKTESFPAFYAAFQATMTEMNIKESLRDLALCLLTRKVWS